MWFQKFTLSSSTRAAARVVSNLGDDHLADYEALLTLKSALASVNGLDVEGVLIYDASAADGAPHPSCFDGSGDPQTSAGRCNYFTEAQLTALPATCSPSCAEFPDNGTCLGGWSMAFCPSDDRETDQATGTTNVGVWIRVQRDYVTGIFPGDGVTMTDRTIMKVEPR